MADDHRVPIPDPTVLTTAALEREVAALHDQISLRMAEHEKVEKELHRRLEGLIHAHEKLVDRQIDEMSKEHEFKRLSQKETFDETKASLNRQLAASKDTADLQLNLIRERISVLEQWKAVHQELSAHSGALKELERVEDRLKPLENFRGQAALIGAGLVTVAGIIGAAIARLIFAP